MPNYYLTTEQLGQAKIALEQRDLEGAMRVARRASMQTPNEINLVEYIGGKPTIEIPFQKGETGRIEIYN